MIEFALLTEITVQENQALKGAGVSASNGEAENNKKKAKTLVVSLYVKLLTL
jgi:hypothetical protein